jgi:predicted nucleic acid-binding Zn ribbon protein
MLTRNSSFNYQNCYFGQSVEVTFQCPSCFSIETLLFEEGNLVITSRWHQSGGNIYHHQCPDAARPFAGTKVTLLSSNTDYLLLKLAQRSQNSLSKIAAEIGVNQITIKRWVEGKSYPNHKSSAKLAKILTR